MFIELTSSYSGKPILININQIVTVMPCQNNQDATKIITADCRDEDYYMVDETFINVSSQLIQKGVL